MSYGLNSSIWIIVSISIIGIWILQRENLLTPTWTYSLILGLIILSTSFMFGKIPGVMEPFINPIPYDIRYIRYGDEIALWTGQNAYIRALRDSNFAPMGLTGRLNSPDSIPSRWVNPGPGLILERKDQSVGNFSRNPVKYGDEVCIRISRFGNKYVQAHKDGRLKIHRNRFSWETFTIVSRTENKSEGQPVEYGDSIAIQTTHGTLVGADSGGPYHRKDNNSDFNPILQVFDIYGNGSEVDWARQGEASQGPFHTRWSRRFPPYNAIDGNASTFNHTDKDHPWLEIKLPMNIYIDRIFIRNRQDCCQERLRNFDLIVKSENEKPVWKTNIKETKREYNLENINQVGRYVRIQMQSTNRMLHVTNVRVYGRPMEPNYFSEQSVSSDIVSKPLRLDANISKNIGFERQVPMGTSRNYTYSFFLKLDEQRANASGSILKHGDNLIFYLKNGTIECKYGNTLIAGRDPLPVELWNHIAVIIKGGVASENGWVAGKLRDDAIQNDKCCYIVHDALQKYYKVKNNDKLAELNFSTDDSSIVPWTGDYIGKMTSLGSLERGHDDLNSQIELHINGVKVANVRLDSKPESFVNQLTIGSVEGEDGAPVTLDGLTLFNYPLDSNKLIEKSKYRIHNLQVRLTDDERKAEEIKVVPFHQLPDIENGFSIAGWIRSDRTEGGTGRRESVFWKGSDENDNNPGLWFNPTNNKLEVYASPIGRLDLGVDIPSGVWYHIALIVQNMRTLQLYLDGELVGVRELSNGLNYGTAPLNIGGFTGIIRDMIFTNFPIVNVKDFMGVHPQLELRNNIVKIWQNVGCQSSPELKQEWINSYMTNPDDLKQVFRDIHQRAQTGDPQMLELCYGEYARDLAGQVKAREAELKNTRQQFKKKCLPTAPYFRKGKPGPEQALKTYNELVKQWQTDTGLDRLPTPEELERWRKGKVRTGRPDDIPPEIWEQLDSETRRKLSSGEIVAIPESVLANLPRKLVDSLPERRKIAKITQLSDEVDELKQVGIKHDAQALERVKNTLLQGVTKMTTDTIRAIIQDKRQLSQKGDFQQLMSKIEKIGVMKKVREHPEFQKLVQLLNTLCISGVEGPGRPQLKSLKDQVGKCEAVLEDPFNFIKEILEEKIGNEPRYQALFTRIFRELVKKDPRFAKIVGEAKQNGWDNDKEYKELVQTTVEDKLIGDKKYRKQLIDIVKEKRDPEIKQLLSQVRERDVSQYRIEDHPDYHRLAREMKRECLGNSKLPGMECYNCQLPQALGGVQKGGAHPGGAMTFYGRW